MQLILFLNYNKNLHNKINKEKLIRTNPNNLNNSIINNNSKFSIIKGN